MEKIFIGLNVYLLSKLSFANKFSEYQSDPSILSGASGSDDYILAIMFPLIIIGSFAVAHIFRREYYTPVKEVFFFIVVSIGVMIYWALNN